MTPWCNSSMVMCGASVLIVSELRGERFLNRGGGGAMGIVLLSAGLACSRHNSSNPHSVCIAPTKVCVLKINGTQKVTLSKRYFLGCKITNKI